jgi:hypothetical protein
MVKINLTYTVKIANANLTSQGLFTFADYGIKTLACKVVQIAGI